MKIILLNYLKSLCQKYLSFYRVKSSSIKMEQLIKLARKAEKAAEKNYQKLSKPKTCDLSTYTTYCAKETVLSYLAGRSIKKVSVRNFHDTKDSFAKAVAAYFSLLPLGKFTKLRSEIFTTLPYSKRETVWKKYKPLFNKLEKRFIPLILVRNNLAKSKGYIHYTDMILANDQIPKLAYQRFIKNIDTIITWCNQKLPKPPSLPTWFYSKLNIPCFICQLSSAGLMTPEDVIDIVGTKQPILRQFRHKISICPGNNSRTKYCKETDTFEIRLCKNVNNRHQMIDLIHELGHVAVMLKNFRKKRSPLSVSRYAKEKAAMTVELTTLKKLSPMGFQANLAGILLTFHRALFELEVYANPNQNLPRLYAQLFNRCFPEANQQTNNLYLLDECITARPLSSLTYAVAYGELLIRLFKNSIR